MEIIKEEHKVFEGKTNIERNLERQARSVSQASVPTPPINPVSINTLKAAAAESLTKIHAEAAKEEGEILRVTKDSVQDTGLKPSKITFDELLNGKDLKTEHNEAGTSVVSFESAEPTDDQHEESLPVSEEPTNPSPVRLTVFNCNQVNLRSSPEHGLEIISVLSAGTEVQEMDSIYNNDVIVMVCTAAGIEGFVQRAYLKG